MHWDNRIGKGRGGSQAVGASPAARDVLVLTARKRLVAAAA